MKHRNPRLSLLALSHLLSSGEHLLRLTFRTITRFFVELVFLLKNSLKTRRLTRPVTLMERGRRPWRNGRRARGVLRSVRKEHEKSPLSNCDGGVCDVKNGGGVSR